jgi:tRNA threonylcarbamoyladenosine biosynthesis protein TsaE
MTQDEERILLVGPDRAGDVVDVIHGAFAGRPALDPPATAVDETEESVADALARHGGLLAEIDGRPVATLLFLPLGDMLGLRRVGTLEAGRSTGVAQRMVAAAEAEGVRRGYRGLRLIAREELPATVRFWNRLGYHEAGRSGPEIYLRKILPIPLVVPDPEAAHRLGLLLAEQLHAGDLVILTGDLGAGKTTLTRGIGAGLGVRGDVTSPTFVIARVHRSLGDGPELVHVDAYRLSGALELDDLDLDTDLDSAVTVVEWGEGLAETLAEERLEIELTRDPTGDSEVRGVVVTPVGKRWFDADLPEVLAAFATPATAQ